jgi:hypothetical protein
MLDWFKSWFDQQRVYRQATPPNAEAWSDSLAWEDIVRVCLEMEGGPWGTDSLYIFTRHRPESYVFPLATDDGQAVLNELIRRGLFDAQLAIDAALGEGLYCWPKDEFTHGHK